MRSASVVLTRTTVSTPQVLASLCLSCFFCLSLVFSLLVYRLLVRRRRKTASDPSPAERGCRCHRGGHGGVYGGCGGLAGRSGLGRQAQRRGAGRRHLPEVAHHRARVRRGADDEIQGRTQGFVRRWEIVEGSRRIETVTTGGKARRDPAYRGAGYGRTAAAHPSPGRHRRRVQRPGTPAHSRFDHGESSDTPTAAERLQADMAGALKAQGFEVASEGSAEVVLKGALDITPTVRMGDTHAPYGVGDMVAACRARLALAGRLGQPVRTCCSRRRAETSGRSFQNDQDACQDALTQLTTAAWKTTPRSSCRICWRGGRASGRRAMSLWCGRTA